jgi:hypothetical protein
MVFTEEYHLKRGYCCKLNCLHCPYDDAEQSVSSSENTFCTINCPTCFESFQINVYPEEGSTQSFIYDCEVCCSPISLKIQFEGSHPVISSAKAK